LGPQADTFENDAVKSVELCRVDAYDSPLVTFLIGLNSIVQRALQNDVAQQHERCAQDQRRAQQRQSADSRRSSRSWTGDEVFEIPEPVDPMQNGLSSLAGAEKYGLSKVTIRPLSAAVAADSASLYIRAIPPVGVRESSWGAIKKRFSP
jgi:hypothetical protein